MTHVGHQAAAEQRHEPTADDRRATWKDVVAAYVGLTKPRVIELLLLTTVPVMFFAARGVPPVGLVLATVVGGTFSAGSASVFNCVYDRDIDEQMRRTRRRALPRHIVSARAALVFGTVLGALSVVVLLLWVNPLSALLAVSAEAFYVFVYTLWLKRTSTQNIVIGGAAGAVPALVGWSAVTNSLDWAPVVLFLIIFFWTPPHFWALAIKYRDDYAAASVPMLPAVATLAETARKISLYTVVLVATTLVFAPVADMGAVYLVAALVLGGLFGVLALAIQRDPSERTAMRLFSYSITYMTLLFAAMIVDVLV